MYHQRLPTNVRYTEENGALTHLNEAAVGVQGGSVALAQQLRFYLYGSATKRGSGLFNYLSEPDLASNTSSSQSRCISHSTWLWCLCEQRIQPLSLT